MIKFKEQDGELFRILDEPVPLTPDAEVPCIIAPIQDDSPMGRYVKQCWGHDKLFMREYTICGINADMAAKVGVAKDTPLSIHMFEIIGTFVEEGSKDWALYQMMQGNKVRHESYSMPKVHCAMNEKCQIAIFTTPSSMIDGGDVICHANDWLTSRQVDTMIDERTGWQIYEPEPQYKAGDFVEMINWYSGTKHLGQIDSIDHEIHIGTHRFDTNGNSAMERVPQLSIIRKLKPSEVVVDFGSGIKGTIKRWDNTTFHIYHGNSKFSKIHIDALDIPTREIVESLLKAQDEEK